MPSDIDLKTIKTMNKIQNNQVTHEDINLVERTFGKSKGSIKGAKINQNDIIDIPEELF